MSFYAFAIIALAHKFNQDRRKAAKEAFENAQQYQEKKRKRVRIDYYGALNLLSTGQILSYGLKAMKQ